MVEINLATENDIDFFYDIKRNSDNMYWSGHSSEPTYNRTKCFLLEQIQNQNIQLNRKIYIISNKLSKSRYGYLYFDPIDSSSVYVSISVLDKYSGNGVGKEAMSRLMEIAYNDGYKKLIAEIREDNTRSQRLFDGVGFKKTEIYRLMYIQNIEREIKMIQHIKELV